MALQELGTFPASALNIGLAAAPIGLTAEISQLSFDISKLTLAVADQLQIQASFPPSVSYAAAFGASFDVTVLANIFNPANWVSIGADANASLLLDLGLIEAQLDILAELMASFELGLSAPGIAGWSYAGNAAGFGAQLKAATESGFGGIDPCRNIDAVIIGTASLASWQSFSNGFDTGGSANTDLGETTSQQRMAFHGVRGGGDWSRGLSALFGRLGNLKLQLEGLKAGIEMQLDLTLGLNLPEPKAIIEAALDIDLGLALENFVNIQLDLDAQISGLQARIDAILELIADINLSLSAGGLTLWSYSGPAKELGSSFIPHVQNGLPNAGGPNSSTYGLVLASASPSAWAAFGNIFKVS